MTEKEIFKLIPLIAGKIGAIEKNRKNSQQCYAYRGIDDVMSALSPLLAEHGVFPIVEALGEIVQNEIVSKSGNSGFHSRRVYRISLVASDGSSVYGIVDGEAIDYGDKSLGKCASYAYRDFLLKTFCIPTSEEKDIDQHSHELENINIQKLRAEIIKGGALGDIEAKWISVEKKLSPDIYQQGIGIIRDSKKEKK